MPSDIVTQINVVVNLALGIIMSVVTIKGALLEEKHAIYRYLGVAYALVGIYVLIFYFLLVFFSQNNLHLSAFARPITTVIMTCICVEWIWRMKIRGGQNKK